MKIVLDCGQKILEWEEWEARIATSTVNFQYTSSKNFKISE